MHEQLRFFSGEVRSALRFRWIGLGIAWVVCLAGWIYVATLPDVYEARASFLLDTSSLLTPVLDEQIIAPDPESQLEYIRATLLGTDELETVAHTVGLDASILENPLAYEAMLRRFRDNLSFSGGDPAAFQRPGNQNFTYNLAFRHTDRQRAIDVVEALVNTFIESAMGEARSDEDAAIAELDRMIAMREEELRDLDRQRADFYRATDSQPGAQGEYLDRLQNERDELADLRRSLTALVAGRDQILERMERLRRVVPSTGAQSPPNSTAARLVEQERVLAELRREYTDESRRVVQQAELVEELRKQREQELADLGLDDSDLLRMEVEANPAYAEAEIALGETEVLIAQAETEIAEREANVQHLASLRDESLDNETKLAEIERDYDVKNDRYLELVESREELLLTVQASAAEQMDFRSIEDPHADLAPVEPNRLRLILAAFVMALGAGAAACYGLAQLRPVFGNARSLQTFAGLPVLGTVTNAWPVVQRVVFRRSVVRFLGVCALLFLVFVGVVGIELLGPGIHAPFRSG